MIKFGIKSAILGSAIYYTIDKGVWKDSVTTSAIYEEVEKGVSPYVGELRSKIPYEFPPLPTNDKASYMFKHYWNRGVKSTFKFLIELPTYASNAVSRVYQMATSAMQAVEPAQDTKQVEK